MNKAKGISDKASDVVLIVILSVVLLIVAYPLYYVVVASFSNPYDVYAGKTFLLPSGFTFDGYKAVFADPKIVTGFLNSVKYTVIGTCFSVIMLYITAYPLAQKDLPGRKWISLFFVFTMYFGGGMIPSYIVMISLGLRDTIWGFLLPGLISTYNVILMRSFFATLPRDLEEAGEMDGLNKIGVFFRIAIPLSKPIIATMALFYLVQYWNNWFDAFLYLKTETKFPVALHLRNMISNASGSSSEDAGEAIALASNIKSCAMVLTAAPIICVYPFIQKYFVQGMMLGGVKG